jgi:chemotaxis response regulator CheB
MESGDWVAVGIRRRDIGLLNRLCLELNGFEHKSEAAQRAMAANVSARMRALGKSSLDEYLTTVEQSRAELEALVSLLTIHTTSWFRERPHYGLFSRYSREWGEANLEREAFKVLSAGCSTGEEPYSFALVLEGLKADALKLEYEVTGIDVDPVSIHACKQALYHGRGLSDIEARYHRFLEQSDSVSHFRPNRAIRDACQFNVASLVERLPFSDATFDAVVCRNVLIYLSPEKQALAVSELTRVLKSGGLLTIGLSDALPPGNRTLRSLGTTSYIKSRFGQAVEFRSSMLQDQERLMSVPPGRQAASEPPGRRFDALLIGASTGGIEALQRLLVDMPSTFPPVLVVQHIDAHYVDDLVALLVKTSGLAAGRVVPGTELERGHVYVAPAHRHLQLREQRGKLLLHLSDAGPIDGHRPSVTALFDSARPVAERVLACLLTGMGADGAASLNTLKGHGAYTLCQDERSSVVFGMPKRAIELGGANFVGNPWQLRMKLLHAAKGQARSSFL